MDEAHFSKKVQLLQNRVRWHSATGYQSRLWRIKPSSWKRSSAELFGKLRRNVLEEYGRLLDEAAEHMKHGHDHFYEPRLAKLLPSIVRIASQNVPKTFNNTNMYPDDIIELAEKLRPHGILHQIFVFAYAAQAASYPSGYRSNVLAGALMALNPGMEPYKGKSEPKNLSVVPQAG